MADPLPDLDPFDLPEWLGAGTVTWTATSGLGRASVVPGLLATDAGEELACDLVAVDDAHPVPVVDEACRRRAHQSWRHGQVLLVERDGRAALAAPGTCFSADSVLETLRRLSLAVGAQPEKFFVRLAVG
ncbi:hypothetical protein [Nocardioides sp. SYSU D00038]|uniref:hypothetical protein n=1 Tax=Nocardioides sp. SYSU D00038 TaxID=2812554 RepID=UPI001966D15E|nr:hypothetical protein [Nocardioides sp. SYSU D00038]